MLVIIGLSFAALIAFVCVGAGYLYYRLNYAPDRHQLEKDIELEVQKWREKIKGIDSVVAVIKENQAWSDCYGEKATTSSIFQIGSISKVFTATLLQRFIDLDQLHMNDKLGDLIGESYTLSPEAAEVTLYQLVTHTSGFPSVPKALETQVMQLAGQDHFMEDPYNHLDRDTVLAYLANPSDKSQPGRFEYSNYGMGLLAHVMELRTGKTYDQLLQEYIFEPLGMNKSFADFPSDRETVLIQGYNIEGKPVKPWHFKSLGGAGAINSNADDMIKFMQAQLDEKSFMARTLALMHKPQPNGKTAIGWMLPLFYERFQGNRTILWHNGTVHGYFAYLSIDTTHRTSILLMANKSSDLTLLGSMLTRLVRTQSWS